MKKTLIIQASIKIFIGALCLFTSLTSFCQIKKKISCKPATPSIVGLDSVCVRDAYVYSVLNVQAGTSYLWGVRGQTSIEGQNVGETIQVKNTGSGNPTAAFNASVWVVGNSGAGCASDTVNLVLQKLVISNTITASSNVACPNSRTGFKASYHDGEYYDWSISPSSVGSIEKGQGTDSLTVQWNNNISGAVTIRLRIRKCGGSGYNVSTYTLNNAPNPVISIISEGSNCRNGLINFTLQSTANLNGATVQWNFGDGTTATGGSTIVHTFKEAITAPKTYTVTALITNLPLNNCVSSSVQISTTYNFIINPTPNAIFEENFVNRCQYVNGNNTLKVQFNSNFGNADSIIWYTPKGVLRCGVPFNTNCLNYPITSLADTGFYNLVVKNNTGCSDYYGNGVYFSCPLACVDNDDKPQITISGDTVVNCGAIQLTAISSRSIFEHLWEIKRNGSWWLSSYYNTNASVYAGQIAAIGKYPMRYRAGYIKTSGIDSGALCYADTMFDVIVPMAPQLSKTITCSNNAYQLKLADFSGSYTGTSNIIYKFYVDGALVQNSSSNVYNNPISAGVQHTMQLIVSYTYNNQNYSCSTKIDTLAALPAIPTAHFTTSAKRCEGIPIRFTYSGIYNSNYSYVWDFGDKDSTSSLLHDPVKVYVYDGSNPTVNPTLTINTGYCTVVYRDTVSVVKNGLGDFINDGNYTICPNMSLVLYHDRKITTMPDIYNWYDARGTGNITTPIQINVGSSNNTYSANSNGAYWLGVENNDGCYKALDGNAVVLVKQLPTPIITSNPAKTGNDTFQLCVNNSLSLSTEQSNTILNFDWYINGQLDSSGSNSLSFAANSLPADSVYSIYVVATYDIGNGQTCTSQSRLFVLKVNNAPEPPTIEPFTALDCRTYSIGLTATSNIAGVFTWSNGYSNNQTATQSNIVVNKGGLYSVMISTGNGCTNKRDTIVPNSVRDYFNTLVNGCYRLCVGKNGFTVPLAAPSPVFNSWQWLYNWQPYTGGTNSQVQPLILTGSGMYSLAANNGLCTDTAFNAIIDFTQPENCSEFNGCSFFAHADNGGRNVNCDSVYIHTLIDNLNPKAAPYYITINGVSVQGGVALPGKNFGTISIAAGSCGDVLRVGFYFYQTTVGVTRLCDSIFFDITTDDCPNCRRMNPIATKPINKQLETKQTYLFVQPTVAHNECRVFYKFNESTASNGRAINLYNNMGSLVKTFMVQQQGVLNMNVSILPKGLYLVQLVENGKVLQLEKMIVE